MSSSGKKERVLTSWIGGNDLDSLKGDTDIKNISGPIVSVLNKHAFDSIELLYNYPQERVAPYIECLKQLTNANIHAHHIALSSPVNFGEIYVHANIHLEKYSTQQHHLSILISPGTPAMQAVWILLGKTRFPCTFLQSSLEQGVQEVDIPFELSAEYLPAAVKINNDQLEKLSDYNVPVDAAFDHIVTNHPRMLKLKAQAQILAEREVPVLISGETGTGKELFARAVHNASARKNRSFVALNCGAIPPELVDSVLFGHKKGAFTGASSDKPGVFDQANGGTLFLDEFGELDAGAQVRLLRVIQEGIFVPVGGSKEIKVDVRIITATHQDLIKMVADGHFREDLFYRIAVGVLHLPPLRDREGDLSLLADNLLDTMRSKDSFLKHKKIYPDAKNIILKQPWPGNVRELQSTLLRAALWSKGDAIQAEDIRQALFSMPCGTSSLMERGISQGIDIQSLMGEVATEYIRKALDYTGHNKTRTAQLLGLKNYQTLNNWMDKYGIS